MKNIILEKNTLVRYNFNYNVFKSLNYIRHCIYLKILVSQRNERCSGNRPKATLEAQYLNLQFTIYSPMKYQFTKWL